MTTIAISGGLDPIHDGHIDLLEDAARYGNVIVILNSDEWLVRKKKYFVQPWSVRARIMSAFRNVAMVAAVDDSDGTVCEALRRIRPDYFANGGDRTQTNTPELELCKELGIKPLFGIGGAKTNSSSRIVEMLRDGMNG